MNFTLIEKKNQPVRKKHAMGFFSKREGAGFFEWFEWTPEKELEMLVFRVSRKPRFLEAHVERIYHCIAGGLNKPLLGALLDLVIILEGSGRDLLERLLAKAKPKLSEQDFETLYGFALAGGKGAAEAVNPYSVFSKGMKGAVELL